MEVEKGNSRAIIFCWSQSDIAPFEAEESDYIICADSGADYAKRTGFTPDITVGDFDSSTQPETEKIVLPAEKDDTDAMYAARLALNLGYKRIYLAGGFGGREDHTLGALAVLRFLTDNGADCVISDGRTRAFIIKSGTERRVPFEAGIKYISIFPSGAEASGVNIKGLKYCLNDSCLKNNSPVGVSNEFVDGKDGFISTGNGDLMVLLIAK